MNDPKRLRADHSDRVTRLLLEAGRAESPGRPRLARIATAAAGAGATLSAKAAASSAVIAASPLAGSSVTSLAVVLKWLGLGALGGVMISATASEMGLGASVPQGDVRAQSPHAAPFSTVEERQTSRPAPTSAWSGPEQPALGSCDRPSTDEENRLAPSESAPAPSKPSVRSGARQTTSAGAGSMASGAPARNPPSNGASAVTPEPTGNESLAERALREEVAALALAKSALNQGAGAAALDAVRAYRGLYPQGRLAPEATYIEMEAALLTGDRARAEQIAERLASGTTPSAKRAREILKGR